MGSKGSRVFNLAAWKGRPSAGGDRLSEERVEALRSLDRRAGSTAGPGGGIAGLWRPQRWTPNDCNTRSIKLDQAVKPIYGEFLVSHEISFPIQWV